MLLLYDEMKEIENDPNSFKIWYGFHSFYLASSHITWAECAWCRKHSFLISFISS